MSTKATNHHSRADKAYNLFKQTCLDLASYDKPKAIVSFDGYVAQLKHLRDTATAKQKMQIDGYIKDIRKIVKKLKAEIKALSWRPHFFQDIYIDPTPTGHMSF